MLWNVGEAREAQAAQVEHKDQHFDPFALTFKFKFCNRLPAAAAPVLQQPNAHILQRVTVAGPKPGWEDLWRLLAPALSGACLHACKVADR